MGCRHFEQLLSDDGGRIRKGSSDLNVFIHYRVNLIGESAFAGGRTRCVAIPASVWMMAKGKFKRSVHKQVTLAAGSCLAKVKRCQISSLRDVKLIICTT